MKEIKLIAVSGKIGSGKDEICKIIQKLTQNILVGDKFGNVKKINNALYPSEWKVKKFAGILKQMTALLIGCTVEQLEDQEFKNKPLGSEWDIRVHKNVESLTPRKVLQLLGTECLRDIIHPNAHVNALFANTNESDKILISDCRFPNEAKAIRQRNGVIIRTNRGCGKKSNEHPSETALDYYEQFDYIIDNNGSLQDLEDKVKLILQDLKVI